MYIYTYIHTYININTHTPASAAAAHDPAAAGVASVDTAVAPETTRNHVCP